MFYLAMQIIVYLLIALLIGAIIGWWLKGYQADKDTAAQVDEWKRKLKACEDRCASGECCKEDCCNGGQTAEGANEVAMRAQISALESTGQSQAATIAQLEADLAACKASKAAAPAAAAAPANKYASDAPKPAHLTDAPTGEPDDLKLIKGVGPKLEKMLNELGIWHFHQVAAFSDRDVEWVQSNLTAFQDRIVRDNWVAQAADLAKG